MNLEAEIQDALAERHEVSAIACMDEAAGLVLGLCARPDVARDAVELAVLSAPQLCSAMDVQEAGEDVRCDTAIVVSGVWVQVFARVPRHPELVVLGLAKSGANLALLRTWLKEVADRVGNAA